ncbi:MAG TPA: hypothetical protein VM324_12560 [Egibacteraceae bacterium]|nr:hypothetical protein [Egibacteraceae bacterium]
MGLSEDELGDLSDWNDESDINVLLVAAGLPDTARERLAGVALPEDRVRAPGRVVGGGLTA